MFEDVDKPIEPTKPLEGKQPSPKNWGPFQPVSRSAPPKTTLPDTPLTESGYPDNLNAPMPFDQEQKPKRGKYIILGIVILIIIVVLISGAIFVLNNLNKLGNNANTNTLTNANIVNQNINLNTNSNVNATTNTQNVNVNTNNAANTNLNANANNNINTNVNISANANENLNTNTASVIDSDNDGLEDKYETTFGTSPNNADSDGDSYNDLQEIKNRYNPAGPGKITSLTFNLFCQKFIKQFVENGELSDTESANTCEVATEVFNLTDSFKSKIDQTAEQKLNSGCQVLDKKSENCQKAIWLIALTFQNFDSHQ